MSALQNEINRLNTLKESYDRLSNKIESIINIDNLAADIVAGKEKLASSISYKGVYSSSADSLEDMAIKIRRIPQVSAGDSADSGTEEDSAHYDSNSQFNPYLVAKALESEQLPSYIPEYMYSYRNRYAPSSFLVGEYSGVNSIVLTGADGYLTSDGHFYSYANMGDYMQVTHTFPDGSIETYESTTIEHIWDVTSKKMNAFVVYYYYDSAYSFITDLNNVPLSAVICGKCTKFTYGGADVMRNIIVLGELEEYSTIVTNNKMYTNQVLPSRKSPSGYMFHYTTNIDSIVLPKLNTLSGQIVNTASNNTSVKSLCLPNLKSVTENYNLVKMTALEKFICGIEEFPFTLYHNRRAFDIPKSLRILMYPKLKVVSGEYTLASIINLGASIVEHVSLDSLEDVIGKVRIIGLTSDGSKTADFPSLRTLYMPKLKRFNYGFVIANSYLTDLIDVTVGELETSIDFTQWTATNILADPDKTIQLQNNIHNHIAERVKDVTGEAPLTITFSQGVRNVLLPETETLFAAKNWNIAPTRTE